MSTPDIPQIENLPVQSFGNRIDGHWDCGVYGTLILNQQGVTVFGDYTYRNGTVLGFYKENVYKGNWKQSDVEGQFEFQVISNGLGDPPYRLEGRWNTGEGTPWRNNWICERN